MDASTNVLAEEVRAKRVAVDNDLELLRVRLQEADPRRMVDVRRWARTGAPILAGTAAIWLWARRRRSVNSRSLAACDCRVRRLNSLTRSMSRRLICWASTGCSAVTVRTRPRAVVTRTIGVGA